MKPILKWAGGKTKLLAEIRENMPERFGTYYEPFFGGGAICFGIQPNIAVINDKNRELMNCYRQTRDNLELLINELDTLAINHSEEFYYQIRNEFNNRKAANNELNYRDAAMFIYLNKAGFNGMYRENLRGQFNIPSGHRKNVSLYDRENIEEVSNFLQNTEIRTGDFEDVCNEAVAGDFVFLDSPYHNTFDGYQQGGFDENEHRRVKAMVDNLTARGVYCMTTNNGDSEFINELYDGYRKIYVDYTYLIGFHRERRKGRELIITNYDLIN